MHAWRLSAARWMNYEHAEDGTVAELQRTLGAFHSSRD